MTKPYFLPVIYSDITYTDAENEPCAREELFFITAKLLDLLSKLEGLPYGLKLSLALPPIYFEMTEQASFQKQMAEFLKKEKGQFPNVREVWLKWEQRVIIGVKDMVRKNKLEVLAAPVTGAVLPFVTTSAGALAHIREGISLLEDIFQIRPKGFWFPGGAYTPGLDLLLKKEGIEYSFVEGDTIKFGDPTPSRHGMDPVCSPHGLVFFPIHQVPPDSRAGLSDEHDSRLADTESGNTLVFAFNLLTEENGLLLDALKSAALIENVFFDALSYLEKYKQTLETVHLCSSFLRSETDVPLINEQSPLLAESFLMEKELESFGKLIETGGERRIFKQMLKQWLLLSGLAVSSRSKLAKGDQYIRRFKQLKSLLTGPGLPDKLEETETADLLLTGLSLEGWLAGEPGGSGLFTDTGRSGLRVIMLTWEYPPNIVGGLARHVHGLSGSLARLGYEVHVITAQSHGLPVFEMADGVIIHRVTPLNEKDHDFLSWVAGLNLAMVSKVNELAVINDFHIIHAHDWLAGAAALCLKDTLNIPLIVTVHATEHGRNNGIYTEMQQFIHQKEEVLLQSSDHVIVCSEYMKEELKQVFQTTAEKISIIPNGVTKQRRLINATELLQGLPFFPQRKMIFSIGRMVREKGFDTLIEAASLMKDKQDDIYFVIAGKGPLLEEYRRQVKDRGLEKYVYFIGFIQDEQRNAFLTECEAAVFPSLYEPFGIVALESMIFGKPTIVSETGGLKGIVQPFKTGLFMSPGSSVSLMEQLSYLLEDSQRASEIGVNGQKVVESLFSWSRIAEETRRVFEDALLNSKI